MTAGYLKIFSPDPKLGFLARASLYESTIAAGDLPAGVASAANAARFIFNDRLDAAVTAFFMLSVIVIIAASAREWWAVIAGRKPAISTEVPFEPRIAAVAGD
jgi:carbon starvation protein